MTSGVYQYAPRFASLFPTRQEFNSYHDLRNQLYYRDGLTTTVTVEKRPMRSDGRVWLVLTVNGKVDASSVGDMETQVLLGHAKLDTTALYTRVATSTIRQVMSPLDRIVQGSVNPTTPPPG